MPRDQFIQVYDHRAEAGKGYARYLPGVGNDNIILTMEDLAIRWNLSYSRLDQLRKKGYEFPQPIQLPLDRQGKRFRLSDVLDFEERCADAELFVRNRRANKELDDLKQEHRDNPSAYQLEEIEELEEAEEAEGGRPWGGL